VGVLVCLCVSVLCLNVYVHLFSCETYFALNGDARGQVPFSPLEKGTIK